MVETICRFLDISRSSYFRYQKKGVPVVEFLKRYFTKEDLDEVLESGRLEKLEMLEFVERSTIAGLRGRFFEKLTRRETTLLEDFAREVWIGGERSRMLQSIANYEFNHSLFIGLLKDYAAMHVQKETGRSLLMKFQPLEVPEKFYLLRYRLAELVAEKPAVRHKPLSIAVIEDDARQAAYIKEAVEISFDNCHIRLYTKPEEIHRYKYDGEDLVVIDFFLTGERWDKGLREGQGADNLIDTVLAQGARVAVISGDREAAEPFAKERDALFLEKGDPDFFPKLLELIRPLTKRGGGKK